MTRGRFSLAVSAVGAAACLLATGCLIPYAYPKLSYVPGCGPAGPKVADVHAFRVDVTANQVDLGETGEYTLTEITPRPNGSIPSQARLSVERGMYVYGPLSFNVGRRHTTRVRLYCPGYQLVELESWDSADAIRWQITDDWAAREKAIDDLLRQPTLSHGRVVSGRLPAVTASPASTRAFVLAAAEYEVIAAHAPTPEDAARLREKARRLIEIKPAAAKE